MAIAFGSAGTRLLVGTASTSWAVPFPASIAAGDLLVLHISTNGGAVSATPPTGFTEVYREATLTNPKGGIWIKVASGSETGNLTVTVTSTTGNAQMFRYTGVDTTTPQDATATNVSYTTNTSPFVLPSITTVTANTVLIYGNSANSGTVTMTGPAGSTEQVDHGALGGTGSKAGALYDEAVAATGATGTRSITLSAGRAGWGAMLALRPATGGGTPGDVAAVTATATAQSEIPVVTGDTTVIGVAATGTSTGVVPVVSAEALVEAVASTGTADAIAPAVVGDQNVVGVAATASATAIAPSVVGGTSPGAVLNIGSGGGQNHFEVQVAPTGGGAVVIHTQAEIEAGYDEDPYFTTIEGSPNRVQFYARLDAPVVGSSAFSRSELREVDASGNDLAFNALSGTHVMSGRTTITHLPPVKPEIIIAQLHNGDTDRVSIRTQLVSGTIRLRCRINGSSVAPDFASPYTVGTEFQWKIELVDGTANIYYNDMVTPIVTSTALVPSAHPDAWYFKAGMYNQSNVAAGDVGTEYGQAELRDLTVSHTAGPTNVDAVVATGTADAIAPAVGGDAAVVAVAALATSTAVDPAVSGEQVIASVAATATADAPAPAVDAASTVSAVVAEGSALALAPAVEAAQTLEPPTSTATAAMGNHEVGTGPVINPLVMTGDASSIAPAISAGTAVVAVAATATGEMPAPTVGIAVSVDSPAMLGSADTAPPVVSAGVTIESVASAASSEALPPTLEAFAEILAFSMIATSAMSDPAVSAESLIEATLALATAIALNPRIGGKELYLKDGTRVLPHLLIGGILVPADTQF